MARASNGSARCGVRPLAEREVVDRELMLPFALIEQAAVVQRLGMMRIDGDRLVEFGQCLFDFSGFRQRLGARGVTMGVARAGLRRGRHLRGGFLLGS